MRMGYRQSLKWILYNDDTEFLEDEEPIPSVTVAFLADVFDVSLDKILTDLKKLKEKTYDL